MVNSQATIGVLALQGAFDLHCQALARLKVPHCLIKTAAGLQNIDGLIIPGGEFTTIRWLLEAEEMTESLARFVRNKPVLGTCAGMILLAKKVADDSAGHGFGAIDIDVRRNAYGRQVHSHSREGIINLGDGSRPFPMVFIRAPRVERVGERVQILGRRENEPAMVAEGNVLAMSFHPELSGSDDIHRFFIQKIVARSKTGEAVVPAR